MEQVDPSSGRSYYYHIDSGSTSWERPVVDNQVDDAVVEEREQSGQPELPDRWTDEIDVGQLCG